MTHRTSRRRLLQGAGLAAAGGMADHVMAQGLVPATPVPASGQVVVSVAAGRDQPPVARAEFGFVGSYDADWFTRPEFERMLDNFAASPGAFHGVRYFGPFTAGETERLQPEGGGRVWTRPDDAIDFTPTFDALAALTGRGLVPFVALGFFPPAVSPSPRQPPRDWSRYQRLVASFLTGLAADPRFGPEALARWWFEAWNEPNEGRFWTGTIDEYFDLYRATSRAIQETGLAVRLGGPAIAYKPQASPADGAPWMERFLRFIAAEPDLKCDFISYHRQGTVGEDPPDPRRMYEAAVATAEQMLAVDPERFGGMPIVNNEADEKVGFEQPYAPRLDQRNAAWLGTVAAIHGGLAAHEPRYAKAGFRFFGAADNANLQLVETPFDGRRSLMTLARQTGPRTDLLKIPAYGFYELLRLLGDQHATVLAGAEVLFPATDVYHLATVAASHAGCLLTCYPDPGGDEVTPRTVAYEVRDLPWPRVNVARFQIDGTLSNAYAAAGGAPANPFPRPEPADLGAIRLAQEVTVARPIARDVRLSDGVYRETIDLAPYTTICLWFTPVSETVPVAPAWQQTAFEDGNVIMRWTPDESSEFYGYEVVLMGEDETGPRLTPDPLRAAMWVDTAPPAGQRTYGVRTISASGVASSFVTSQPVTVR